MSRQDIENQELTMKSLAAGTATLDNFLIRAYYDYDIQNFFTFSRNRYRWVSHAKWQDGGNAHPSWMALSMFNKLGTGDMLEVKTTAVPTVDLPKFKRRKGMDDAPLAACYATRRDDRVTLFLLSRRFPGYPVEGDNGFTPVTVKLPFTRCRAATLYRMAGDPTAHNLTAKNVAFEHVKLPPEDIGPTLTVDASTGADPKGLPPAATFIYVFDGTDAPAGKPVVPVLPGR